MLINNIEYALRFWIDNEDENTICDEIFDSFDAMNAFLKTIWHSEEYEDCNAYFSPVEVINGKPDDMVRFIYDVAPVMPMEQDEIDDFLFNIKEDFEMSKELGKRLGQDSKFTPKTDAADYELKKQHRDEITYICPYCFREIDDCRCAVYSYTLVQIDKLIVPVIRTLNQKGYITTACCSGHINEDHCTTIYVAFKDEHNFGNQIPEGARYSVFERLVKYDGLKNMDAEQRKTFQIECIKKLENWAKSLPEIK